MSEEKYLQVNLPIKEATLERLKSSLPNLAHRRSGTQAVTEAIEQTIAHAGAVVLDESLRRDIANRAGVPLPKTAKQFMDAFEAATRVTPLTVHVEIDPGIASEIQGHARDRGFTFQEMAKEVLEQSVVDRYLYSVEFHGIFFHGNEWKALVELLGVSPKSGRELVAAVKAAIERGATAGKESAQDVALANEETIV